MSYKRDGAGYGVPPTCRGLCDVHRTNRRALTDVSVFQGSRSACLSCICACPAHALSHFRCRTLTPAHLPPPLQVAFIGFCVQALATRTQPIEGLTSHLSDPFGKNITYYLTHLPQTLGQ